MPADQKLYGLPGPQNSAVLMDIISKLKQDLHQSRLENSKLVDQLNCLIALVKRAWGMEAPNFSVSDFNRNTPIPDKVFNGLHKMGDNERLLYRPREHFDDPNRYKQGNLFDPNVIFSPEMMWNKKRPSSASESSIGGGYGVRTGSRARSGSAVFLTEEKPNRPLKYETTRPISGKRRPLSGNPATRGRIKSAPARRAVPPTVVRKDLHSKSAHDFGDDGSTEQNDELQDIGRRNSTEYNISENDFDLRSDGVESQSEVVEDKPPMAVRVKKGHPMDKFVEDLRMVSEMEETFKKTALQLQKKLGLETSGFV
ncbi:hypothetical protein MAR_026125 [Mya arenaria]|uniref:Uncharacterized protein n=1 Tax=Mya arenaria TaxID=6604 RepID=A0ABY7EPN0_MYAAR|nr:hypothetical protein MAR_026125 [Mya arenaria]